MSTPLQKLILVCLISYLAYNFILAQGTPTSILVEDNTKEGFYDWQTLAVDPRDRSAYHESTEALGLNHKDRRFPHYVHVSGAPGGHQLNLFNDPECLGEGSCIYSKDSQNDCVLPDWKCACKPNWEDPPLDSDIFDFKKRHGYLPDTSGCLCTKY